jgi:hypothetical protein
MTQTLENPIRRISGRRLIGVGIRDVRHDAAALRWAVFDARPGHDAVRIIHAVEPFDGRRLTGWEAISAAVAHGSRQRSSVAIIGSPSAGPPERVLQAESAELAVLVLGDDEPATPHRRIASHLRRSAHCPVVCVPRGTEIFEHLPVTVVADDLGLSDQVLEFAAQYAERHQVTLEIARTVDPATARAHSSLVVVGRASAQRLGMGSLLTEPLCPTAFIPDRWQA